MKSWCKGTKPVLLSVLLVLLCGCGAQSAIEPSTECEPDHALHQPTSPDADHNRKLWAYGAIEVNEGPLQKAPEPLEV